MATTTTAYVSCPQGDWTLLADGATYSKVGIQSDGAVAIAVAASKPAPDSGDHLTLGSVALLTEIPLGTGDKLYGQAKGNSVGGVRLYRVTAS